MHFSTVQLTFADITPIISIRQFQLKSCHRITVAYFIELAKQRILTAKTSQFKASCEDSKKLQES
jgi:hypothetical protein